MKKLLILLLPYTGLAQAPPICFNLTSTVSVGTNPGEIITGDFNSDGKIDLGVTNVGSNNISVLLGLGTGIFSAAVNYTTASSPQGIVKGDFNNDGKLDLAVTNYYGNNISILMGIGNGSFLTAVNYPASNPLRITTGDFNNDGNIDLAVASSGINKVSVLMGSPTGTFAMSVNYSVGNTPSHIISADLNNDGKLDLVVSHFISTYISVLINTGLGSFNAAVNYSTGFNNGSTIICKDYDGDNQVDIFSGTTGRIHFFKGIGNGTFFPVVNTIVQNQPYSMVSKDFNSDGIFDLVTGEGSANINTYTISPTAVIAPVGSYSTSTGDYSDIATNDFNNDGKFDLAVSSYGTNKLIIFLNGQPNVLATSNASAICNGNNATIAATGANTYSWSTGASSNSITVSPTITTTYTLIGNGLNSCSNTSTVTIIVNTPIITVNNGAICSGNSFTITPSGASTYTISGGLSVVSPTVNTNYNVVGTSAQGCTNTAVSSLTVYAPPTISVTSNNTLICIGQTATLIAAGAISYTWSSGSNSASIVVSPSVTTMYTINGSNSNGCTNVSAITQSVSLCTAINNSKTNIDDLLFKVYPNPNNGKFTVEVNENLSISITNALGQLVFNEKLDIGKQSINIESNLKGLYFMKVSRDDTQQTFKLIIE